jgi:hypothetical protein
VELSDQHGQSVCSIFTNGNPDNAILQDYGLIIPKDPVIVPSSFLVLQRELVPYQYVCIERNDPNASLVCPELPSDFFDHWNDALTHCGIHEPLGVSLKIGNSVTLQTCDIEHRVDCSEPLPVCLPPGAFPTEWAIDLPDGRKEPEITRRHWCGGPVWSFCSRCQQYRWFINGICQVCYSPQC